MLKSDVKDTLERSGFVFTDLPGGGRTTHGSQSTAHPVNNDEPTGGPKILVLCLSLLLLTACTDTPESVSPKSQPLLPWKYPDSVQVSAVSVDENPLDGSVPPPKPDNVSRKWLDKHDYAKVGMEVDTSFADSTGMVHMVTQTWVRVE